GYYLYLFFCFVFFFFQAEDGIRDRNVTGVQTCALPISCIHHRVLIFTISTLKLLCVRCCVGLRSSIRVHQVSFPVSWWIGFASRSEERRVGKECRCRRALDD